MPLELPYGLYELVELASKLHRHRRVEALSLQLSRDGIELELHELTSRVPQFYVRGLVTRQHYAVSSASGGRRAASATAGLAGGEGRRGNQRRAHRA
jgi:hypothetical protein